MLFRVGWSACGCCAKQFFLRVLGGRQSSVKFHLRVRGLRLCWRYELAAISSSAGGVDGGSDFRVAQFRFQKVG